MRTRDVDAMRQRILVATYDCVSEAGLSKTTIEDSARKAGVSRATAYRYFPGGREELMSAVVEWEYEHFFERLYEVVCDAQTLEEVMERGLHFAHQSVAEHKVLQMVLATEPELLLPVLTVRSRGTQKLIAEFLIPYLMREELAPGIDIIEAAAFLARMVLSYISASGCWNLDDPNDVSRLVRGELLAGILLDKGH